MDDRMNHHLRNLSNQLGHDVSNKYHMVIDTQDLSRRLFESKQDLQYPLLKESKRDRFLVSNSHGLANLIGDYFANYLMDSVSDLENAVALDTAEQIADMVNGLTQINNTITIGGNSKQNRNLKRLVQMLTREFIKGIEKIINDNIS